MRDHDGRGGGADENRDEARHLADVFEMNIVLARAESRALKGAHQLKTYSLGPRITGCHQLSRRAALLIAAHNKSTDVPATSICSLLDQFLQAPARGFLLSRWLMTRMRMTMVDLMAR